MQKFRIMVQGEDGTLFCNENGVSEQNLELAMESAIESYPFGTVWPEKES